MSKLLRGTPPPGSWKSSSKSPASTASDEAGPTLPEFRRLRTVASVMI
jgi:hypothetical protein